MACRRKCYRKRLCKKKQHKSAVDNYSKNRQARAEKALEMQNQMCFNECALGAMPLGTGGHAPEPLASARGSKAGGCVAHSTNLSSIGPSDALFVTTRYTAQEAKMGHEVVDLANAENDNASSLDDESDDERPARATKKNKKESKEGGPNEKLPRKPPRAESLVKEAKKKFDSVLSQRNNMQASINHILASTKADSDKSEAAPTSKKQQHLQAAEICIKLGNTQKAEEQMKLYEAADT